MLPSIMLAVVVGIFLLVRFHKPIIKSINPLYGSRLKSVMKSKNSFGDTIYIIRWRPGVDADTTPLWEMRRCGIDFISDDELRRQATNPKLPAGYSVSTCNGGRVLTLVINQQIPHKEFVDQCIPSDPTSFFAGIRFCHLQRQQEIEHSPSVLGIAQTK